MIYGKSNIKFNKIYYNLMGPPSYMRSVADRNVVMRHIPVQINHISLFPAKPKNLTIQKLSSVTEFG